MTWRDSCFPVSSPQGVANWQTASDSLISNALLFSGTPREMKGSGKQKSGSSEIGSGGRKSLNKPAPPMAIQRRYEPAAGALDDLVEVLYQLLADTGDHEQSVISSVGAGGTDIAASKEAT